LVETTEEIPEPNPKGHRSTQGKNEQPSRRFASRTGSHLTGAQFARDPVHDLQRLFYEPLRVRRWVGQDRLGPSIAKLGCDRTGDQRHHETALPVCSKDLEFSLSSAA